VIVAEVPRSLWVHESANGYFRRVGHAKRKLTPDGLARLFQQRSQARLIRFEEQEVPGAGFKDLDSLLVNRFTLDGQGDPAEQLQRLHLVKETDEGPVPTVAGVLLCSLSPQRWLRSNRLAPPLWKAEISLAVRPLARAWEVPAALCVVGG
jgi:predicted HTH transcriptional regulator